MKQLATTLILMITMIGAFAQDSLKVTDSTKFSTRLAEVTVIARKPVIVQAIDKTVVDVKGMIGSAALTTIELLERVPGITVNSNGEISLNGRSGVLVLVDGRSTYMSAPDLAAFLKSIPASNVDKIELIDNPSSKYDASGNAIINIKLKRNRTAGLTGNFTSGYSQGVYPRTNNSLGLQFNRNKLNVYTNLAHSASKEYTDEEFDRLFYTEQDELVSSLKLANRQVYSNNTITLYSGFDYQLSAKSVVGASVNYNYGERNGRFEYLSNFFDDKYQPVQDGSGNTLSEDTRKNLSANLNFQHQFNKDGHELSADINYLQHKSGSNRTLKSLLVDSHSIHESDVFRYEIPVNSNIYVFKADYVRPLSNKTRLEAGIKTSLINNDNVSDYYDIDETLPRYHPEFSNHFKYDENINAAYFNATKTWHLWQAQLGMRAENFQATGIQLGNAVVEASQFRKSNTQFFPSVFILHKLDSLGKNTLSVLATRRINRPNYFMLNPFIFVKDEYTYTAGNPNLNPQYQYRLEIKFQHRQLLSFGLSYNKFTQVIFNTTEVKDEIYISRPENIARGFMVLLNSTLTWSPAKWWNMNAVLRLAHLGIRGNPNNFQLNPTANTARFEFMNFFTAGKLFNGEFGGYYASRDLSGQSITNSMYRVNAAIQKRILKDKGTLRFGVDDMLHSWKYRNRSVDVKQSLFYQVSESDTQRFNLSLTYRFGKDNSRKSKINRNVNDEEKGRLE